MFSHPISFPLTDAVFPYVWYYDRFRCGAVCMWCTRARGGCLQPSRMRMPQKRKKNELWCISVFGRVSHLVCGRPKFVPTPTRGRLWTTFLTVAASGKFNMTAAAKRHREIRSRIILVFLIEHKITTYLDKNTKTCVFIAIRATIKRWNGCTFR